MNEISDLFGKIIDMHKNYKEINNVELEKLYDLLKEKLSNETRPEVIAKALDRDIVDLMQPFVWFMFDMYQKAIELDPLNEKLIKDFLLYVDIHSGPDWEEEVREIRKLLDSKQIEQAAKAALQIDYNKTWD